MIATSGLVSRIHACDFSNPEKTRFQYGSSVLPLSSAAPMAGTCDEPIPATILATASLPFRWFRFGFGLVRFSLGFGLCGSGPLRRSAREIFWRRVLARPRAIALDRASTAEHHVGVVLLRGAGHIRGKMLKRMAVGRTEFRREIDISAELQHAVVIALEDGFGLLRRKIEPFEVCRLVRLEGLAVLVLHQRHAEHIDAKALTGPFSVEHKSARYVIIIV